MTMGTTIRNKIPMIPNFFDHPVLSLRFALTVSLCESEYNGDLVQVLKVHMSLKPSEIW